MKTQVNILLILILILNLAGAELLRQNLTQEKHFNASQDLSVVKWTKRSILIPFCHKVHLFLCNNLNNPEDCSDLDSTNLDILKECSKITFIIHGWRESRNVDWYSPLTKAFLKKYKESCVIEVDWSWDARKEYTMAQWDMIHIGDRCIGPFIADLVERSSIPIKNFIITGFSLGGQMAGFIGKAIQRLLNQKLPIIFALDPAGPLFVITPKLIPDDAEKVYVLHTNAGCFGFGFSCGTIDFWPNGGRIQPGCPPFNSCHFRFIESPRGNKGCDHLRAPALAAVALNNFKKFKAKMCSDYEGNQCFDEFAYLGDLESDKEGNFYLDTTDKPPYY